MTVEEPKTTAAESAASSPEDNEAAAGSKTDATEVVAADQAPVEPAPEASSASGSGDAEAVEPGAEKAPSDESPADTGAAEPSVAEASSEPDAGAAEAPAGESASDQAGAADAAPSGPEAAGGEAAEAPAGEAAEAPAGEAAEAPAGEAAPAQPEPATAEATTAEEGAAPETAAAVDDRPEPTTMEELLAEQPGDIPSLKHGDVVEGKIVRIDKDEMLVDVGAKSEGVVSNRELYGRNAETQPDLNIGDTVLVYVLQPESTDGHAVLSLRRAGLERKWRAMQEQFDEGVIIEAPVIDHNKGGLIVDCGIRGFVPISQIVDFPRRPQNDQPRDAAQEIAEKLQPYVGRKLRLKILEVNRKANRLILSEKVALYEERREKRDELFSSLETGQKVKGTVRSIAPFGIFVDLGGIDGLVHKSELSWNKVNNPEGAYDVGDEVEAEVIDINHERGRISLSIRRLLPDPWQSTVADLKVGDITEGTVTKIVNFGAFVRVKDGLEGLIHISELSHQRVAHPGDVVHEGQTLKLKIISLDSERHRLGLSLKQAEEAPARPARERRPRREGGGFDRSQAIQEPEGGIDNTLAAAFAQVRQQMAEQDAADTETTETVDAAATADSSSAEAVAEVAEAVEQEAQAEEAAAIEDATAAEVVAEVAAEVKAEAEAEVVADVEAAAEADTPAARAEDLEQAAEAEEVAESAAEVEQEARAEEAADLAAAAEAEVTAEIAEEVKEEVKEAVEDEVTAEAATAEAATEEAADAAASAEAAPAEAAADESAEEKPA